MSGPGLPCVVERIHSLIAVNLPVPLWHGENGWVTSDGNRFLNSAAVRRAGIAAGVVLALGGLAYAVDRAMSSGEVPRGVQVAGVDIGGLDQPIARNRLEAALNQRVAQPLTVRVGDVRTNLVPRDIGLRVDWDGTWARIGEQPNNPFTRLWSLFGTRTVEPAVFVDDAALTREVGTLRAHDRQPVEGGISFEGAQPVPVRPVPGRTLDVAAARTTLTEHWADGSELELPVTDWPARVRPDGVDRALREIAQPAVSGPVTFTGKGGDGVIDAEQLAGALSFQPDGQGGLALSYKDEVLMAVLAPQLVPTEVQPRDANFDFTGGRVSVVPAVVGNTVDWDKTLEDLAPVLKSTAKRSKPVAYHQTQPALTTEAAEKLGITEVVGTFTTGGFSGPSGTNIHTVARKVDGALIKPGETFSLNDFTGTRGTAQGYVESGIINNGRPAVAVGGGISQFATTLYNAAYFAGMEDGGHTEHSYYISRYPEAREATVFDGAIDLKFRNTSPYGAVIETLTDSSSITVRLWGTKTVDVESITGARTKPTDPKTVTLPAGKDCIASAGAPGFTTSNTRVITDHKSGKEISRHTRTVKYDPIPVVTCE